jgi:hypothetical protein
VSNNVATIKDGWLTLSRITYYSDLQRGIQFPLGVMAEIAIIGSVHGLGLIARTGLEPSELASVGRLVKDALSNPFEFLKSEFEWAWNTAPAGGALSALCSRHSESLFFAPPVKSLIRRAFKSEAEVADFARRQLREKRDDEFDLMLAELLQSVLYSGEMAKVAA